MAALWLQVSLAADPKAGVVMEGSGGLRKVRFARPGMGKSGGVRVCYAYFPAYRVLYLLTSFGKNERADLTKKEKSAVAVKLEAVEKALAADRGLAVGPDRVAVKLEAVEKALARAAARRAGWRKPWRRRPVD